MRRAVHIATLAAAILVFAAPRLTLTAPLPDADVENQLSILHAALHRLEARVDALETLRPSFAAFMPDFSERFHIMHAAGDAGDWAVADHELKEMQRLLRLANIVDVEKGELMNAMLANNLEELESAIQHRSQGSFVKALSGTVTNCNACHAATGSAFIQVALDVPAGLTMRHPHQFASSKPLTEHKHGH